MDRCFWHVLRPLCMTSFPFSLHVGLPQHYSSESSPSSKDILHSMPADRAYYLSKAQALCKAFSAGTSPSELASYFASSNGEAYEHGPFNIAALPFLGRSFKGTSGIIEYFETVFKYLKVNGEMRFSEWTCDVTPDEVGEDVMAVVTTRGKAEFEYVSTGKA